jgi:hypothetical protein
VAAEDTTLARWVSVPAADVIGRAGNRGKGAAVARERAWAWHVVVGMEWAWLLHLGQGDGDGVIQLRYGQCGGLDHVQEGGTGTALGGGSGGSDGHDGHDCARLGRAS